MAEGGKIADLFADLSLHSTQFSAGLSKVIGESRKAGSSISKALTEDLNAGLARTSSEFNKLSQATATSSAKASKQFAKVASDLNKTKQTVKETTNEVTKQGNAARQTGQHMSNGAQQASKSFKDVSRIVSGILISQAFYSVLRQIKDATTAVGEFSMSMEQARVSFTLMLGSADKANTMLNALQDFAAKTPFRMQDATTGSRRLMAMGFAAENVIPIMQDLSDAASLSGKLDPEMLDRMVTALGQMQTKGRVATQELMQLSEAGIPSFKILQEELGLTKDQISKIGDLHISSDKAIPALLKGIEKRYKGASDAISHTTGGLISTIKDDMLFLSSDAIKGPAESFRNLLQGIADNLEKFRSGLRKGGVAGLIQAMFPPEMQGMAAVVLASLASIGSSIKKLLMAFGPPLQDFAKFITGMLSLVLPVFAILAKAISEVTYAATHSQGPLRVLAVAILGLVTAGAVTAGVLHLAWAIKILGIARAVAGAVTLLKTAIQTLHVALAKNPIVALVMIVATALIGLAMSSKTVSAWLDTVMKKIAAYMGVSMDMGDTTDTTNEAIDEFNKNLTDSVGDLSDVGKEAGKTGKKVKDTFIASFDEVHQIPDKLGDVGDALGDMTGNIGDMKLPTLPDVKTPEAGKIDWSNAKPPILPKPIIPPPDLPPLPVFPPITLPKPVWPTIDIPPMPEIPPVTLPKPTWPSIDPPVVPLPDLSGWKQLLDSIGKSIDDWATNTATRLGNWGTETSNTINGWRDGVTQSIDQWAGNTWKSIDDWATNTSESVGAWGADTSAAINGWRDDTMKSIDDWANDIGQTISAWASDTSDTIYGWGTETSQAMNTWRDNVITTVSDFVNNTVGQISNWATWLQTAVQNVLTKVKNFFANHKTAILLIVGGIILGIILWWAELPAAVMTAVGSLATMLGTFFTNIGIAAASETEETKTTVTNKWSDLSATLSNLWQGIVSSASTYWGQVTNTVKGAVNGIISHLNSFIDYWDSISFDVPAVDIPGLGTVGGFSIGVPQIPRIPYLAAGAVVKKDQLVRVAEGQYQEGVIPLGGGGAEMVANALADAIASRLGNSGASGGDTTLQIGVLVADQLGLKELERQLRKFRNEEEARIHGPVGGAA